MLLDFFFFFMIQTRNAVKEQTKSRRKYQQPEEKKEHMRDNMWTHIWPIKYNSHLHEKKRNEDKKEG